MEAALTGIFGVDRRKTIRENTCAGCNQPAKTFRDDLSRREYRISGLCQSCQDAVFGGC